MKDNGRSHKDGSQPIAVIGSGCRFPGGASSPSKLWDLLSSPQDVLKEIPDTRFNPHGFYHPDGEYHGHSNVKHSYVLDEDHRTFDADFFNVSANEAAAIDPQQRLLMECVYEAMEAGGQTMGSLKGSDTAVFVGLMCEEYSDLQARELNMMPTYFPTGTARSVVSNRISYFFDWHGPSMTIDTACSSSLVAVHQGVQALRSRESRVVIAAGTNLIMGPEPYIAESTFHMLSPKGRSHMWDAGADGYGRGDGVAAVVLKCLDDAIADGDTIDYVIRETGVNHDGRTKGITVPSASAQVDLVHRTYQQAGLDVKTASGRPQYFEAHGTGTLAGDPIEAEAIYRAIASHIGASDDHSKLMVGSIKTVIGHTEGTAGIAGLIKAGLAVRHAQIPPNLLFKQLNPAIEPFYHHIEVPTELQSWPAVAPGEPRRASVNSFGFGGANAHCIVESFENAPPAMPILKQGGLQLSPFVFSAHTKSSLKRYLKDMVGYLDGQPNVNLADIRHTLSDRRSVFPFRATYAGHDGEGLSRSIKASIEAPDWEAKAVTRIDNNARLLGVFTGQGAQWQGMAQELVQGSTFARRRLEQLESDLAALSPSDRPTWSLTQELLADKSVSRLSSAVLSQPLCTAVQILLIDLLHAAGISFSAVVGHSSGEIACAYAAGILTARDAIVVAYYRGFHSGLAQSETGQPGIMMAVGTSPEDAEEICAMPQFRGRVCVAACNSPDSVTLSGDADAIEEVKVVFEDESKFARILRVDKAYHSHHMKPCGEAYLQSLRNAGVSAHSPSEGCRWFSSVFDGQLVADNIAKGPLSGQYWVDNMTRQVTFSSAVQAAFEDVVAEISVALEVGPRGALKSPVLDTLKVLGKSLTTYTSCLTRNQNCQVTFTEALGELWKHGADGMLIFDSFERALCANTETHLDLNLVRDLPTYAWDHDRIFWHESRRSKALRTRSKPGHPLLGTLSPDSTESDLVWHNVLRLAELPWLKGHALQGQTVFPAAGYVAFAIEAAAQAAGFGSAHSIELQDLEIGRAITFENEGSSIETMFALRVEKNTEADKTRTVEASFRAHSCAGDSATVLNSSGRIRVVFSGESDDEAARLLPSQDQGQEFMVQVDEDDFYSELAKLGYQYSGPFRALHGMQRKFGHGRGYVAKSQRSDMHLSEQALLVHPGFLDAAFQAIFLAYSWPGDGRLWSLHVPVSIHRLKVDAAACRRNTDSTLAFDSTLTTDASQNGIVGDVDIFTEDGREGLVQVEGIRVVPFAGASAADDVQMFFENVVGPAFPNGELAVAGNVASKEEITMGWVLERISYYYLRRLVHDITPKQEADAAWHHQKLMAYARHMVTTVETGHQPYADKAWNQDTAEQIKEVMDAHQGKIEVRLMRAVGENLPANVRGETHIIQHMMKDGMLDQYYVESLGLQPYTQFLTEIVGQVAHIHPHMHILEIGAGTGGATKSIMRKIDGAFDRYCFTDISSGFFETAKGVFSQYESRMLYQALDAEKDISEQGFQDQSYDLVIASLVLHATKDLAYTLRNVRRLLRPGGYLIMLEVTSNATMRMSFTMGGLSGWWLGAESGRPWSPCVSSAQWHSLLLESGYTGIEASTPERDTLPRPFGVLVSRANDDLVELLTAPGLSPSPMTAIGDMVIITGGSLDAARAARAAQRQLQPHCSTIHTIASSQELASLSLHTRPSVLNLSDWSTPLFEQLTEASFSGIKALFAQADALVWVTHGRQSDQPYANMSVGFGRAMMMELPHLQSRMRFIDFEPGAKLDAGLLVDEVLRIAIVSRSEMSNKTATAQKVLWSNEPEVLVARSGERSVSRVKGSAKFNNGYNAGRRDVCVDVNPASTAVEVIAASNNTADEKTKILRLEPDCDATNDVQNSRQGVELRVRFTSNTPFRVINAGSDDNTINNHKAQIYYPCLGIDVATGHQCFGFSQGIKSLTRIPSSLLHAVSEQDDALSCFAAISTHVFARVVVTQHAAERVHQGALLILGADAAFVRSALTIAAEAGVEVVFVNSTSSDESSARHVTSIHSNASDRVIRRLLPIAVSSIIDLTSDGHLSARILQALGQDIALDQVNKFMRLAVSEPILAGALQAAVRATITASYNASHALSAVDFLASPPSIGSIIDWSITSSIAVPVGQSDETPLLRGDRTYLLVGLAGSGGLGLSLAEYLVRQGAKFIILTSRKPKVNQRWIDEYAAKGVRIDMMANDVTKEADLGQLVSRVRASWPQIAGVANGAMVLQDSSLETMSYEEMMSVLRPKVDGTRILDSLFARDDLDFFIMFSSLSCVFGNSGQSNYAAANMYMISLAAQRRIRGVAASIIDIGAVMGTGYMAREVTDSVLSRLVGAGYRKMSERDFHLAFANAILTGRSGSDLPEELITGLHVAAPHEKLNPAWAQNARFQHVVRTGAQSGQATSTGSAASESARDLLRRARSEDDISFIITGAIVLKLQQMLQLSAEVANDHPSLLRQATDMLGIDSLMAVQIRSWMLREVDVDIPVLRILGDVTVQDLVDFAIANVPSDLTLMLGQPGSANLPATIGIAPVLAGNQDHGRDSPDALPAQDTEHTVLSQKRKITNDTLRDTAYVSSPMHSSTGSLAQSSPSSRGNDQDNKSSDTSVSVHSVSPPSFVKAPFLDHKQDSSPSPLQDLTIEKIVPMSYSQSRFWVMSQIVQDPTAFNITANLEITSRLDISTLKHAIYELGIRHEALRTCFYMAENAQPVQGILKDGVLKLEVLPSSTSVRSAFEDVRNHRYNLGKGETMKIVLVSSSATLHNLLIGYHHINMDSTSLAVLIQDLRRIYQGERTPPPLLQYPDFASSQIERLRSGYWDEHIKYWKEEFVNSIDPLPILNISPGSSRPRPTLSTYGNIHAATRISSTLAKQVQAATRNIRSTAFHLFATVFQVLLSRLAGTTEIVLGIADANRSSPGAMDSIGNYLNLLPLHLTTSHEQRFSSLVSATKAQVLAALSHSAVPFEVIMEEIGTKRSATHSPLFQAFIDYRHVNEKMAFGNGHLEGQEYALSKVPYDVMLDIIDGSSDTVSLNMIVQEGLYTSEEAELLLRCYVNLLTAFASNTALSAGDADIWDVADIQHALKMGKGPIIDLHYDNFVEELDEISAARPKSIALKDGSGKTLSYAQTVSKSHDIAQALLKLNMPRQSRVGVLQQPTIDWLVTMFGIWRAGLVYVPLEMTQGAARLAKVVREANLAAIVVHDETMKNLSEVGWHEQDAVVNVDIMLSGLEATGKVLPRVRAKDEAMVFYTSGSTGNPKGIAIPHRVVENSLRSFFHSFPMTPQTVLQQTALSFDVSWWTALLGLSTRGKVIIALQAERRDPAALTNLIVSEGVSLTFAVPSESVSWLQDSNLEKLRTSQWSWHCSGGEPYSLNLVDHLRKLGKSTLRAINVYGPTETMIPCAHEVLYDHVNASDIPIPIGNVLANYSVSVVDERGRPVPANIPGHLIYGGAGIASGYVNNLSSTAERFPGDKNASPQFVRNGWTQCHLSGDRGYLRSTDGAFILQARIDGDTQVKLRGLRMDMMDIEANLISQGLGNISQAVVHVRKPKLNDTSSHYLAAHVVLSSDSEYATSSQEGKATFMADVVRRLPLPDYMRPSRIVAVASLPLNHHGKLDRRATTLLPLEDDAASAASYAGETARSSPSPASPPDKKGVTLEIWRQILGEASRSHNLKDDSDFFLVGGNSLLLLQVQSRLQTTFNVDVPLAQLFQHSTLAQMASLLGNDGEGDTTQQSTLPTIDWHAETQLESAIQRLQAPASTHIPDIGVSIVLTGATGFLGRALLRQLVQSPRVKMVHCIAVRSVERLDSIHSSKFIAYAGDLTQHNFGLDATRASNIFSSADIVVHNGADTSFMKSYASVKAVNMAATKGIARLALEHGYTKQLHYVSTAGIAAQLQRDLYDEPLGAMPPSSSPEGYVLSKWASEIYLEKLHNATELPLTIHRPTAITGPDAPRLDVMSNVLHFSEKLRSVPEMQALEGNFQFVDVEKVARDMVDIMFQHKNHSSPVVQYRNHFGESRDTIDIHGLADYLGQKLGSTLSVQRDADWIQAATEAGLPHEVAAYLTNIENGYQKAKKRWLFPRIWNGVRET